MSNSTLYFLYPPRTFKFQLLVYTFIFSYYHISKQVNFGFHLNSLQLHLFLPSYYQTKRYPPIRIKGTKIFAVAWIGESSWSKNPLLGTTCHHVCTSNIFVFFKFSVMIRLPLITVLTQARNLYNNTYK